MLKNRLGLRNQARLDEFEALSVALRSEEPLPDGRFSAAHYRAVHRHLFQDVYAWAGRYRTVRLIRERSSFCFPEHIPAQMHGLFGRLRADRFLRRLDAPAFAARAASFLGDLNAIHPFREGNGRTQLSFLALMAAQAGHSLDLSRLHPREFLEAMIASFFGDEAPLREQIHHMLSNW